MSYPPGYDIVVHIKGLYQKGDEVKYWGAMPGTTSSQNRAFHDVDNLGTTTVKDDGTLVVEQEHPDPLSTEKRERLCHDVFTSKDDAGKVFP